MKETVALIAIMVMGYFGSGNLSENDTTKFVARIMFWFGFIGLLFIIF